MRECARNSDEAREFLIDTLQLRLGTATSPEERREIWTAMREAIKARSASQIEKMEREKGLRSL